MSAQAHGHYKRFDDELRERRTSTLEQIHHQACKMLAQAPVQFGHGTDNAADEALWLVRHALDLQADALDVDWQHPVSAMHARAALDLVQQRIDSGKPAAYLTGHTWFAGHRLFCDQRALVPRSPFAELIIKRFAPWLTRPPERILDLCTGGGAIAIACAHAFPRAVVVAADIDAEALALAAENVALHQLEERVMLCRGDLFEPLRGKFDLIVSNPPYVPEKEYEMLGSEFKAEPRLGLAAGADGMDLVARIINGAGSRLGSGGNLFVEVGVFQAEAESRWPDLPLTWLDLDHGGAGIFHLQREALP